MSTPESRVRRLVEAARRLSDPGDPLGSEARRVLPAATGLSRQGVELVLREHLETSPSDAEIRALLRRVEPATRAHVVLSASVCTAAHRAIALALAASSDVSVRPSRRDPDVTRLLSMGTEGLFRIVSEVAPAAGDHAFLYGGDDAIAAIVATFPDGVVVHAHGTGLGVAAVDESAASPASLGVAAADVARDVVPFDQRGCLSPRVVLVEGSAGHARAFAFALAEALAMAEHAVPRGRLSEAELAAATSYDATMRYTGEIFAAGSGLVGLDVTSSAVVVPPPGRHLHVVRTDDVSAQARTLAPFTVAVGAYGATDFVHKVRAVFRQARVVPLGRMQRPPFDGPVDQRSFHV